MFLTTEPTMSKLDREIVSKVVRFVSKGYYFYEVILGPDTDMPGFERKLAEWVEEVKESAAITHPNDGLEIFTSGLFCILLATPGLLDLLAQCKARLQDVRTKPIPCCGYGIKCERQGDAYSTVVLGQLGDPINFVPD